MWSHTVWATAMRHWLKTQSTQRLIWSATAVWHCETRTTPLSSSGVWVTRQASARTSRLATAGSESLTHHAQFTTSVPRVTTLQILYARCMPTLTGVKTTSTTPPRSLLSSVSTLTQWVTRWVASRSTGILSVSIQTIRVASSGTSWIRQWHVTRLTARCRSSMAATTTTTTQPTTHSTATVSSQPTAHLTLTPTRCVASTSLSGQMPLI